MAKQTINQGTAPTGAGGDTFRSGSAKLQANDDEIYSQLGATTQGVLPAALPISKGGTGVTNITDFKNNIGWREKLLGGSTEAGKYTLLGVFNNAGTGANEHIFRVYGLNAFSSAALDSAEVRVNTRGVVAGSNPIAFVRVIKTSNTAGSGLQFYAVNDNGNIKLYLRSTTYTTRFQVVIDSVVTNLPTPATGPISDYKTTNTWGDSIEVGAVLIPVKAVYTQENTTVDANGFIKAASPIVKLYSDHIDLNDEAKDQPIIFEKMGIGDYLIQGSSGFSREGWYIETPKDANGNVLFSVIYTTLENGDISVKTYKKKFDFETVSIVADLDNPVDITEGRWIDLRLQELPQPETEMPESIAPPEFQPTGLAQAVATVMESYHDPEQ